MTIRNGSAGVHGESVSISVWISGESTRLQLIQCLNQWVFQCESVVNQRVLQLIQCLNQWAFQCESVVNQRDFSWFSVWISEYFSVRWINEYFSWFNVWISEHFSVNQWWINETSVDSVFESVSISIWISGESTSTSVDSVSESVGISVWISGESTRL